MLIGSGGCRGALLSLPAAGAIRTTREGRWSGSACNGSKVDTTRGDDGETCSRTSGAPIIAEGYGWPELRSNIVCVIPSASWRTEFIAITLIIFALAGPASGSHPPGRSDAIAAAEMATTPREPPWRVTFLAGSLLDRRIPAYGFYCCISSVKDYAGPLQWAQALSDDSSRARRVLPDHRSGIAAIMILLVNRLAGRTLAADQLLRLPQLRGSSLPAFVYALCRNLLRHSRKRIRRGSRSGCRAILDIIWPW